MTHSIDTIRASLDALQARSASLAARLMDAKERRAQHAYEAVIGTTPALKAYSAALADETIAAALVADAGQLRETLNEALAAAEREAQADAKRIEDEAYDAAFRKRLLTVIDTFGLEVPADLDSFVDGAKRGLAWLSTVYRRPTAVRNRPFYFWTDAAQTAGFGHITTTELVAAARVAGDVVVEDSGTFQGRHLAIDLYSGRAAAHVNFDAPVVAYVELLAQAHKPEPVFAGRGEVRSFSGLTA